MFTYSQSEMILKEFGISKPDLEPVPIWMVFMLLLNNL